MSVFLVKEVCVILFYWVGMLVAVTAPFAAGRHGQDLAWFSYCFGCALLGGMSFGHELQHRTMSMLLSQPIARGAIWRAKMLVLAAAIVTTTALFVVVSRGASGP